MRSLAFAFWIVFFAACLGAAFYFGYHVGVHGAAASDQRVYTCSMHPQVRNAGPGLCPICHMELVPLDTKSSADGAVTIDPVVVQNMGIRAQAVVRGPLVRTVRAFGTVREATPLVFELAPRTNGYVERLWADTVGMAIEPGAPLLELYSPELVLAQEELIASRRSGDAALLRAAREKLRLYDVDDAQIAEIEALPRARHAVRFSSKVAGTLLEKNAVQGAPVEAMKPVLRIADLSRLWLDAQVYEPQVGFVSEGLEAVATVDALPGEKLAGRVVFVAPTLDETTRTATARVELDNKQRRLKPGMFARISVRVVLAESALLAPRSAVLDSGLRQVAFVAQDGGRFAPRDLEVGRDGDDGLVEIRAGLEAGERVVTSGQLLLDSESRLREGLQKLESKDLVASRPSSPKQQIALGAEERARVDAFVLAYLALQKQLAADRQDDGARAELAARAAALSGDALRPHREALVAAAKSLAGRDLSAQRKAFVAVSKAAIALVEVAAPSRAVGKEVLVVHCPMVPASWLQLSPPVANPYYGSSMLTCGDVVAKIATAPESGK